MNNKDLRYKNIWLVVGFLMVVFVITETLLPKPVGIPEEIPDKVLHAVAYFGLMGWFVQIYHRRTTQFFLALAFIALGVALEFIQGWGGYRDYEVADMFADASGAVLAWLCSLTRFSDILWWLESRMQKR